MPAKKLNILMVIPKFAWKVGLFYDFPIGLAYISSGLKSQGYNVKCLNLNHTDEPYVNGIPNELKKIINQNEIDVVCTGGLSPHFNMIEEIFSAVKIINPGIINIVGGGVISCDPEMVFDMLSADIGVLNEGDITILEVMNVLTNGGFLEDVKGIIFKTVAGVKRTPPRERVQDIDILPFPDYDGFEFDKYLDMQFPNDVDSMNFYSDPRVAPIIASRGCPYACTFCYHPIGKKYKQHSLDNIFEHIEYLIKNYSINGVFILDELFSTKNNYDRLTEFCHRIKEYNIKWFCQLRVDSVNAKILKLMKESGCTLISYGIESASDTILKSMKKHITVKQIDNALEETYKAGIGNKGNLIFGDTAETLETVNESIRWWANHKKYQIQLSFVGPYPGSPIYYNALERGLIKDKRAFLKHTILNNLTHMPPHRFDRMKNAVLHAKMYLSKIYANVVSCKKLYVDKIKGPIYSMQIECPHCNEIVTYNKMNHSLKNAIYYLLYCKKCGQKFNVRPFNIEARITEILSIVGDSRVAIFDTSTDNKFPGYDIQHLMYMMDHIISSEAPCKGEIYDNIINSVDYVIYPIIDNFKIQHFKRVCELKEKTNVLVLYLFRDKEEAEEVVFQLASICVNKDNKSDVEGARQELGMMALSEIRSQFPYDFELPDQSKDDGTGSKSSIWLFPNTKLQVAQNAPCPCGSDSKYEDCCLNKRSSHGFMTSFKDPHYPGSDWRLGIEIPKSFFGDHFK